MAAKKNAAPAKKSKAVSTKRRQQLRSRESSRLRQPTSTTDLSGADLVGKDFANSDLTNAIFIGANMTAARLTRTKLIDADLRMAVLHGANLTCANLTGANLRGADLKGAIVDDALWKNTTYDEHTRFPAGFVIPKNMKWAGQGPRPRQAKLEKSSKPVTFEDFMKRLPRTIDNAKLDKALSMLKAERFQLFSDVKDDYLVGVVKSQTDVNLVYSCRLLDDGSFSCCTQNLLPCGGLRGSLCKHLLVLIVGLAKAGQLDPTHADQWVLASRQKKPALDKDVMSETFLRYKGAEAGEVDWRPTETIPEDFYTM